MIIVQFLRTAPPYAKGELAGFPVEEARRLRDVGAAKWIDRTEEDAPTLITAPMADVEPNEMADAAAEAPQAEPAETERPATTPDDDAAAAPVPAASGPHKGRSARSTR